LSWSARSPFAGGTQLRADFLLAKLGLSLQCLRLARANRFSIVPRNDRDGGRGASGRRASHVAPAGVALPCVWRRSSWGLDGSSWASPFWLPCGRPIGPMIIAPFGRPLVALQARIHRGPQGAARQGSSFRRELTSNEYSPFQRGGYLLDTGMPMATVIKTSPDQRRLQGATDSLLPISWISCRHPGGDGFSASSLRSRPESFAINRLTEVQLDLLGGKPCWKHSAAGADRP